MHSSPLPSPPLALGPFWRSMHTHGAWHGAVVPRLLPWGALVPRCTQIHVTLSTSFIARLAGSCARAVVQMITGFLIFFAPLVIEVVFAVLGPTQHPSVQHWKKLA